MLLWRRNWCVGEQTETAREKGREERERENIIRSLRRAGWWESHWESWLGRRRKRCEENEDQTKEEGRNGKEDRRLADGNVFPELLWREAFFHTAFTQVWARGLWGREKMLRMERERLKKDKIRNQFDFWRDGKREILKRKFE